MGNDGAAYPLVVEIRAEHAFASGDLSHLRTRFEPPATVLFVTDVRCRRSRKHPDGRKTLAVAEILLPDHAIGRVPRALPAPAGAPRHPLPREVSRLGAPSRPAQESPMRITTDNPPSRKRTAAAARACGGRS